MYVVPGNVALDDLYISIFTYLPYQISHAFGNFTAQNWLAVFCDPHDVVFQVIDGMAKVAVMLHTASILKSSPKGEGFSPIPLMGQQMRLFVF